jgi:signal peptidase II
MPEPELPAPTPSDREPAGPGGAGGGPAGAGGGPGGAKSKVAVLAGVAVVVLALDAISKALVVANLTPGEPVHVIGTLLQWNLLRNSGAAFSLGTGYTVVFTLLAIGVVTYIIRTARRLRSTGYAIAFGLLLGGASGNLADRLFRAPGFFRGNVVDWIDVAHYDGVFNLADSAICCAGAMFVILALLGYRTDGTRGDRAVPAGPEPTAPESAGHAAEASSTGEPAGTAEESGTAEAGGTAGAGHAEAAREAGETVEAER